MASRHRAAFLLVVLILTSQGLQPALLAQQRPRRNVITNEDVERSSPSRPPAPAEPAEATPAEKPATPAPSAARTPEAATGLQAELKKAQAFQDILRQNFDELVEKATNETDPTLEERWTSMADCLNLVLQNNQRTISELEQQIQQERREQPSSR